MGKKKIIKMSIGVTLFSLILAFVVNILFKIHSNGIFSAEWQAGDALNYVASIFGAIGTIILGYIAYKQNDKLQELENNNYIASYGSLLLMNEIHIEQVAKVPVNWELHSEQIVVDSDANDNDGYIGYKFTFVASGIGNAVPALLHIKKCNIFCSDEKENKKNSYLFGENYSDTYSRIAIHKDNKIKFGMTYVVSKKNRDLFEQAIKQYAYNVTVEMIFDIITDKNVVTKCKCRSYCFGSNCENKITWEDKDPMVFFYGHDIVNENNIKIAGENKK